MFKEKKLFVLKGLFSSPEFQEKFAGDVEFFGKSEQAVLVYEKGAACPSGPAGKKLLALLKKRAKAQEFRRLSGAKLKKWVEKEFEACGAKPAAEAVEELVGSAGGDLWKISQEVRKLAAYARGKKLVGAEDVRAAVKPAAEADIFKMIDFIAARDKKNAFRLLKRRVREGDSPSYLLSMITFQFRNILAARFRGEDWERKLGAHPFALKKAAAQAKNFSPEELERVYLKIFQADIDIKTGRSDPLAALDLLLFEI